VRKFILAGLAVWLLLTPSFVPAQQDGSEGIAVDASGKLLTALVSGQPGRPLSFFFDRQGTFVGAVDNPYKDAGSAGSSAVGFLAGKGVKRLVAESFGPGLVEVLESKGITPREFRGNAGDAIRRALEFR
jgi:predicted Fe-Mo cluster-binding NifX family protein